MKNPPTRSGTSVFAKTAKGREEIADRRHKLSPRQRRVLILVDGSKDLDALTTMCTAVIQSDELEEVLSVLLQQGFIAPAPAHAHASMPPSMMRKRIAAATSERAPVALQLVAPVIALVQPKPADAEPQSDLPLTQDPVVIRQVKDFMTTTAHTYLGLLGAGVIQRIERAQDAAQLMSVVGHWHMALHDSKQGTRFAAPYLEQVTQSLSGIEPARKQA